MVVQNVTGWNELMEGKLIKAAFTLYDTSFVGWFVAIVFFTFQALLFIKTKNATLTWVMGFLFASAYVSTTFMNEYTRYILFVTLVLQLAGILYLTFMKRNTESGI